MQFLLLQILGNGFELLQCGAEVFCDLGRDDVRGRQVGTLFEGFVFEPEDVEVDLVALEEVGVVVGAPVSISISGSGRASPSLPRRWTRSRGKDNINYDLGLTHTVAQKAWSDHKVKNSAADMKTR